MIRTLILVALSLSILTASAQDTTKTRHIRTLMNTMGTGKLGIQVIGSMIEQYKKLFPDVDPQFWDDFMKEIKPDDLVNLVIPIYDKYFTDEDIQQLTAFYETPVGRKMVEKLPLITQESMTVGSQWGQELAQKIMERLKAKGYIKST
jgi:hypothetical protein